MTSPLILSLRSQGLIVTTKEGIGQQVKAGRGVHAPRSVQLPYDNAAEAGLPSNNPADVLQEDEQVHRVGRRRDEIEFLIETPGGLVLGMNRQRADAGNVGCL